MVRVRFRVRVEVRRVRNMGSPLIQTDTQLRKTHMYTNKTIQAQTYLYQARTTVETSRR